MTTKPVHSITDKEIATIEALAKKAPSGPWGIEDDDDSAAGALLVSTSVKRYTGDYIARTYSERFAFYVESLYPEAVLAIITRLREAEKDAARYRWLRDDATNLQSWGLAVAVTDGAYVGYCLDGSDLDEAVDAAMQDTKK